ncbi:MAG: hypothetical protein NTV71_04795 [Candidatus Omnitrophica bacterium]|nr:hypothetical protein [Candidatus Omnitrophota bacterium]
MISSNPFTPQSGWEPKIFGGRSQELETFKLNLVMQPMRGLATL